MTQQIKDIFNQRYNQAKWKQFLGQTFADAQLFSTPKTLTGIDINVASQAQKLGYIILDENGIERQIGVYEVTLAPGIILERNRVGLRNLLRKYWQNIDAAFIAYHRPESANWRFTYVSELTGYDAEGEFIKIKTEPKRYTYLLGESESIRTAVERFERILKKGSKVTLDDVKEAFSVEKLSKTFFDEYKKHYDIFCQYMVSQPGISQTIFNGDEKAIRDFNKKLLGRIVFLYFIQKKGWLGVPKNETWGKGDHNFLTNQFKSFPHPELFYQDFLSVLFFDTLNTKRPNDLIELVAGKPCRIPFLNGGLFEEENKNHRNLIFTATLFKNLFNFFDQYNFTIYEDDPNDHTVAVDPEMLGHIFENLLEDNKDKGAYYTPKEIVHYMCQESLIEYLTTWFESHGYNIISYTSIGNPEQLELFPVNQGRQGQLELEIIVESESKQIDRILIEKLLKKNLDDDDQKLIKKYSAEFNNALDRVKICDPAIGSGAFPMGLLHEIFTAKQTLYIFEFGNTTNFNASGVKLNIIQNSIYGVDIERGAVDIARLRFWLSLIVDEPEPKALPNLDYKIVVGNSLVSKLGDDIIDIDWNIDQTAHGLFGHDLAKEQRLLLKKISQEQKEFFSPDSDKKKLSADIRNLKIDLLINQLELMVKTQGQETEPKAVNFKDKKNFVKATEEYYETIGWKNTITQLKKLKTQPELSLNFFNWKLDFPEVMNDQVVENVGFDIVIGNPPYVRQERLGQELKEILKKGFPHVANGTADLYVYFFALGLKIFKKKGVLFFITLNKFLKTKYGVELRNELANKYDIDLIIDFFELPVFQAATDSSITKIINSNNKSDTRYYPVKTLINLNLFEITFGSYQKVIKDKTEWKFINGKHNSILGKVELDSIPLKEYTNNKIYFGIKTGLNEAFELSKEEAEYLLKTESKYLVKKFAKSTDITKYSLKNSNRYFLVTGYDLDIKAKYPSAFNYLKKFENKLIKRQDQGKNWWNLRACTYYSEFEKTKLIYIYTAKKHEFYLDTEGRYINNNCYMIISDDKYLFCYLNSKLFEWYKRIKFVAYGDATEEGRVKLDYNKMITVPIKKTTDKQKKSLAVLVDKIYLYKSENKDTTILEQQIDNLVYKLYELTYEEVKIIDPEFALTEQEYDAIKME
ncbi:Eco57I restriction-modification methylase domain-containing protein [Planktothrix agardhii 1029]|uniref:Eco57I restriction-modification methylase domain-containing protein n=1 Tax=Planktothrix agardhii TaxID=1160 RepID=UPI001F29130E|nr:Eco57I restriction-modification methylase domain-containing protein [Planktothrix agardhii]MCF3588911.1 Eco57I restriction-modification methylase domain-containing protein [Planktothrix agardhii 1029]MCF3621624.1 Eco57I restriction-modification methylase domain-containing protein [Planktothrix agardhii 1030]